MSWEPSLPERKSRRGFIEGAKAGLERGKPDFESCIESGVLGHIPNVFWPLLSSLKKKKMEFPLWLSGLRTRHSVREDVGLIPGLAQWVKDSTLPQVPV